MVNTEHIFIGLWCFNISLNSVCLMFYWYKELFLLYVFLFVNRPLSMISAR